MNRRNDDGENDETIAQTPYFSLGYLRVSHGTTHRTTLKRNRALWRTFIQKVNTARITVRRRIFTVTLPETRIRPCDHCDCGCDTPPEWDRSSGTEQLFRQKQAVPATWTKLTWRTVHKTQWTTGCVCAWDEISLMESRGFALYQEHSHFFILNASRYSFIPLVLSPIEWSLVIVVCCFLALCFVFRSNVVVCVCSRL